jgi:hypothetical protein
VKKPLAQIRVFPGRANHMATEKAMYWTVLVFRNKRDMRIAFHELNHTEDKDDRFGAVVMPQETEKYVDGKWQSLPSLGYVLFSKTQLSSDEIAHEALHMAAGYLRRTNPEALSLGADGTSDNEECLAYAAGRCARQFVIGLYRQKVW